MIGAICRSYRKAFGSDIFCKEMVGLHADDNSSSIAVLKGEGERCGAVHAPHPGIDLRPEFCDKRIWRISTRKGPASKVDRFIEIPNHEYITVHININGVTIILETTNETL